MAASIGMVIGLIKALGAADPAVITQAVDAWLDDHPEATTTVEDGSITYDKLATALAASIDAIAGKYELPSGGIPSTDMTSTVQALLTAIGAIITATSGDIGKALSPKTVADGEVTEWQFITAGGGGGGSATDVRINGTSITQDGVANIPYAANNVYGVFKTESNYGIIVNGSGRIYVDGANALVTKTGTDQFRPIIPAYQHNSVFYALAKLVGADMKNSNNDLGVYTEAAKSGISQMFNAPETVSGSTPTITAKAGVRYICGEVSTLSITAPESGCIDVVFESGTTPTVLTVTSAKSGVSAIKWANGFDPTSLDASTTYEINILDGEFGVVGSWT